MAMDALASGWAKAVGVDRKQFNMFFDKMLDGFAYHKIVVDKAGKPIDYVFLEVNHAFESLTGLKREHILGKKVTEVLPGIEKDPTNWINVYGKVALTGEPAQFENHAESLDKWYKVSAYCPEKGYFVALFEDVTERKKAEEKIKSSNQKISEILESIQDNFYSLDRNWNFIYVNSQAAVLLDASPESLVGKNIWEAFPNAMGTIFEENYRAAMDKREIRRFETQGKYADAWLMITVFPSVDGISAWATDITERKKAEQELRESEQRLRFHSENIPLAVVEWNSDFVVTRWAGDAEKMFGWNASETLGKPIMDLNMVYAPDIPLVEKTMNRLTSGESKIVSSNRNITKDNRVIYCTWYNSVLLNEKGKMTSVFSFVEDNTAKVRAEKALEETNTNLEKLVEERTKQLKDSERLAAIGATAGMVGHDIRNPLQAITSDIYLAKTDLNAMPESDERKNVQESLMEIENNIEYINKIVQDLQDYARPLNPLSEETDLKQIIEKLLVKSALPQDIEVSFKVEDAARKIKADSYFINRIMYNLVTNSVQAMPNGGKLTIKAYNKEDDTIITVKDTGVGIPKEIQGKMFTVMFTTKSKGQGFGLPVVKRMTESLGGKVTFESQEGKGTTFFVQLPTHRELTGK
jgi:PAS domain S-box-containing protein